MDTPTPIVKLALLAAVLASPLAGFAEGLPQGAAVLSDNGTFIGWSLDGNLIKSIKNDGEREKLIEERSAWLASLLAGRMTDADRKHRGQSIAAFLKERLNAAQHPSVVQLYFENSVQKLHLNEYNPNGIVQFEGTFEPCITRTGNDISKVGLYVKGRSVSSPSDADRPSQFLTQYFGPHVVFTEEGDVTMDEDLLHRDVKHNIYVKVRNTTQPASTAFRVQMDAVTVFSESANFGRLANAFAGGVSSLGGVVSIIPVPVAEVACPGADLSARFPSPADRIQDPVGNCHTFASVAILENGLERAYGLKIRLSEQDLFERYKDLSEETVKLNSPAYEIASLINGGKGFLTDGGLPNLDLRIAQVAGVTTGKTRPYIGPRKTKEGDLYRTAAEGIGKVVGDLTGGQDAVPAAQAADASNADKEHDIMIKAFKAFSFRDRFYNPVDAGMSQRNDIIDHLCHGRPVAVGANIKGLDGFDFNNTDGRIANTLRASAHAFAVVGFERRVVGGRETYVFKTRNSWGPSRNHEIAEDELWRVASLAAIDTDKTAAPEGLAALVEQAPAGSAK